MKQTNKTTGALMMLIVCIAGAIAFVMIFSGKIHQQSAIPLPDRIDYGIELDQDKIIIHTDYGDTVHLNSEEEIAQFIINDNI